MKFATSRDGLLAGLQVVSRAVSTRSVIPTLSGVLLTASGDKVKLAATDMELGLRVEVEASAEKDGGVVLPGRLLLDVVRALPKDEVSFEFRGDQRDVEIVSGAARFDLKALPAEDFPPLPDPDAESVVTMPAGALIETIDRVARAASRDEARPILTGVLVSAEGNSLTMVATDSYRLSVKETQLEQAIAAPLEANVPARALQELSRIAAAGEADEVGISIGQNQVVFSVAGVVLSSRLIEGQFPNYRQLLPDTFEHEVRLDRDELLETVRRIGLMAQKNAPLRLGFSDGELSISAQTADVGEASESMPANFQGESFEIGFNAEFLREGIESVGAGEVLFKLITPLRPGLLRPVEDDAFLYLIMPIRLNV
jgi:DNA polymerase III subunit beta